MQISFQEKSSEINSIAIIANGKKFPKIENQAIESLMTHLDEDFGKKHGDNKSFTIVDNGEIHEILFVSIGEEKNGKQDYLNIGGTIFNLLNAKKCQSAQVLSNATPEEIAAVAAGAILRSYNFNKYFTIKAKGKENKLTHLELITENQEKTQECFNSEKAICDAVFTARDLVTEVPNVLYPESYAKICKELTNDGLDVEILDKKDLEKLGMGALLGVARGSRKEPRVVIMKWFGDPEGKNAEPVSFIGKGVTFDTGGISLKPAANMDEMKYDMGGSAAVVGTMRALALRKAKVNAIGIIGLVENMPDGDAQRPGDVVKSMSGQTIEVLNTDAEGRLVLCDILHYCKVTFKPKMMIDLATLTGAIVVALGTHHAGIFSNDDDLAHQLEESGRETGEKVWRLPLGVEYDKQIDSKIADMQNIGNAKGAGSITAAQFLQRFVGETKWTHIDIAGVAWAHKGKNLCRAGATGFGVRLLNDLVARNYEKK